MKSAAVLGGAALLLTGVALGLLASYPIHQNSLYVCFVAMFIIAIAGVAGATAVLMFLMKQYQVKGERLIEATVNGLLARKGLEIVQSDKG